LLVVVSTFELLGRCDMATRRIKKEEEIRFFDRDDDERGVTIIVPGEDDDGSFSLDETMYDFADRTLREAEEQLRIDRAQGFSHPDLLPGPRVSAIARLAHGGRLCVECLAIFPLEAQRKCTACGNTVCPECAIELEELDGILCATCLRSCAEEA
jgi:hypothetical protein